MMSITKGVIILGLVVGNVHKTITYDGDVINQSESLTNFDHLGPVKMDFQKIGFLQYYTVKYNETYLSIKDEKLCEGDCFTWLKQYINLEYT